MTSITGFELPRTYRMRMWMRYHGITDKVLAKKLGISQPTVNRMLNKEVMPAKAHSVCLEIGFPEEILPIPFDGLRWGRDDAIKNS